ncbi:hypothetical protein [Cimodo virus]|uniref:hypothetical protein n=1 Tax=Cimodo virus TaxID=1427476 RepID=UPI0003E76D13|nr:hypothetical protein [Cimodo virus]AHF20713.1 hypothetical protein [Cimodo virus]AHF20725.1 hypothetical protein [Cimodo virus]
MATIEIPFSQATQYEHIANKRNHQLVNIIMEANQFLLRHQFVLSVNYFGPKEYEPNAILHPCYFRFALYNNRASIPCRTRYLYLSLPDSSGPINSDSQKSAESIRKSAFSRIYSQAVRRAVDAIRRGELSTSVENVEYTSKCTLKRTFESIAEYVPPTPFILRYCELFNAIFTLNLDPKEVNEEGAKREQGKRCSLDYYIGLKYRWGRPARDDLWAYQWERYALNPDPNDPQKILREHREGVEDVSRTNKITFAN